MWQAIRNRKVERVLGQQHPDAPAAWRAVVDNSEDLLTSGVIERLAYLLGSTGMEIVLRAASVKELQCRLLAEAIEESVAWPRVSDEDGWREPDWTWLTPSYAVVFEAKWGRGNVPSVDQLAGQRTLCESRWSGRRLLHVALVQSGDVVFPTGSSALVVSWSALRRSVVTALASTHDGSQRRILEDIRDILDARGVALSFNDTLPALAVRGSLAPLVQSGSPADRVAPLPEIGLATALPFPW